MIEYSFKNFLKNLPIFIEVRPLCQTSSTFSNFDTGKKETISISFSTLEIKFPSNKIYFESPFKSICAITDPLDANSKNL